MDRWRENVEIRSFQQSDESSVASLWRRCDLLRWAVAPEHRQMGLGRAAMTAAERLLERAGCPKVNL